MNVKGGYGIHSPTIQGSPAFLNRSIYHARKSLTRLNIRISDICRMYFVQITFSRSVSGIYRLWKFENLRRFLTAEQADHNLVRVLEQKRAKNSRFSASIFPSRAKTARGRLYYIALNNARGHPETRSTPVGSGPHERAIGRQTTSCDPLAWARSLACARDDRHATGRFLSALKGLSFARAFTENGICPFSRENFSANLAQMFAKIYSAAVFGVDAYEVEIEVNSAGGLPAIVVVGLPDAAVKESKDRVTTAITNSGYYWPRGRTTVNLAPADIKKEGPSFDLPIALGNDRVQPGNRHCGVCSIQFRRRAGARWRGARGERRFAGCD